MELTLDQALQKGVEAHKAGKAQEADRYYTAILKAQPKHPDANHNMGVLAVGVGKLREALPFFKTALEINPNIAQFWLSYIDALIKLGNYDVAKSVLIRAKEQNAKSESFEKLQKELAESFLNGGLISYANRDNVSALKKFQSAYLLNPYIKNIWPKIVELKFEQRQFSELVIFLNEIIKIDSENYISLCQLALCHHQLGEYEEAVKAYRKAIVIEPNSSDIYNNFGATLERANRIDEALEVYNKSVTLNSDNINAWVNCGETLERYNKIDELDLWLKKAEVELPIVPVDLEYVRALLSWRQKEFKKASQIMTNLDLAQISISRRPRALNLQAKCFEMTRDFNRAYDCFLQMNLLAKKSNLKIMQKAEIFIKDAKLKLSEIRSKKGSLKGVQSHQENKFSPVFLVGFPRSGTTLLEAILRSHSKIDLVEEKPTISGVKRLILSHGFPKTLLEVLPSEVISKARASYISELQIHVKSLNVNNVCIDKMPLNLLEAPLIHQMYPDAKFILALRHPMDTILSCWMQDFKLNPAMANMVDLDRIVDLYCIAMEMFKICRTNYNLNVHEIRYEDLINNFQKEAEAVLQFLNLQWEPEMENYQERALNRGRINTPSYSQVVQPIYKDAQYRWLNYRKYLEQYLEQVKPWISEFGYSHR